MPQRRFASTLVSVAAVSLVALTLSGCAGSGLALSTTRVQGYVLSADALAQVRVGQSQALVTAVLGSPQTINAFDEGTAWYYVETKVNQTAFGLTTIQERTVLAVYFDKNKRVADKAIYSAKDGKLFTIEGRKTPSYGEDKSFLQSLIESI